MKSKFNFDEESRSIELIPENELEKLVFKEMAERCAKGSQIKLRAIDQTSETFVVELKVNGH